MDLGYRVSSHEGTTSDCLIILLQLSYISQAAFWFSIHWHLMEHSTLYFGQNLCCFWSLQTSCMKMLSYSDCFSSSESQPSGLAFSSRSLGVTLDLDSVSHSGPKLLIVVKHWMQIVKNCANFYEKSSSSPASSAQRTIRIQHPRCSSSWKHLETEAFASQFLLFVMT